MSAAQEAETPHQPASRRKLTLTACCGVHGVQDGLGAALYVLLPVFAQVFGLSYAQVGIIRAATNAAMTLFEIPSGFLSERVGERILLAFGLLAAGTGFLLIPLSTGFWGLALCLFIAGVGAAFQHALSSSIISQSFPVQGRRAALGIYNSSGDAGKLALTALCSAALGLGISWQGVAYGYGGAAILFAAVLFVMLSRAGAGASPDVADAHRSIEKGSSDWGIRDVPGFTVLSIIVSLVSLVQGTFLTFVAFIMIEKQVPASLAAIAVVLTLTGGMLGKLGCGFLAEKLGVVRSLIIVQIVTAAGIVAVLVSPTLMSFCLLPLLGFVLQGSSSIIYATVGDLVNNRKQSRGFALVYSVGSGASIVGPIGFGVVGDVYGLAAAMGIMAVLVLAPIVLCKTLQASLLRVSA